MAQQEEVGSEHERVSSITSKIRWDIKLSLFCGPLTVGAIIFMLILLCCSLGKSVGSMQPRMRNVSARHMPVIQLKLLDQC